MDHTPNSLDSLPSDVDQNSGICHHTPCIRLICCELCHYGTQAGDEMIELTARMENLCQRFLLWKGGSLLSSTLSLLWRLFQWIILNRDPPVQCHLLKLHTALAPSSALFASLPKLPSGGARYFRGGLIRVRWTVRCTPKQPGESIRPL